MLLDQLNCLFNCTFFVWAYGEAQECCVNLLTIICDVDARTWCRHSLDADENVHLCFWFWLALHACISWVKQWLTANARNANREEFVHVHDAKFVALNRVFWCEVGEHQIFAK